MGLKKTDIEYWWFEHLTPDGNQHLYKVFVDYESCYAYALDYLRAYVRENVSGNRAETFNKWLDDGDVTEVRENISWNYSENIEWGQSHLQAYTTDNNLEVMNESRRRNRVRE